VSTHHVGSHRPGTPGGKLGLRSLTARPGSSYKNRYGPTGVIKLATSKGRRAAHPPASGSCPAPGGTGLRALCWGAGNPGRGLGQSSDNPKLRLPVAILAFNEWPLKSWGVIFPIGTPQLTRHSEANFFSLHTYRACSRHLFASPRVCFAFEARRWTPCHAGS
jgi:hypothetical protein